MFPAFGRVSSFADLIDNNRTLLVPLISMLKLLCYVRGDDSSNTFGVNIDEDEIVVDLKDAIKEKMRPRFGDIPAESLSLWKVSVPYSRDLKNHVEALNLVKDDSLQPPDILSELFSSALGRKEVHIIIGRPRSGEL